MADLDKAIRAVRDLKNKLKELMPANAAGDLVSSAANKKAQASGC
jgi:hypothetical protein